MTVRGAFTIALLCAAAPALSGCVAAAIPVIAGAMVAKKQVTGDGKRKETVPPRETRVSVFAGEGSARASLAPVTLSGSANPTALATTPAIVTESVNTPAASPPPQLAPVPEASPSAVFSPAPAPSPSLQILASPAPQPPAAASPKVAELAPIKPAPELTAPPAPATAIPEAPAPRLTLPPVPVKPSAESKAAIVAAPSKGKALVLPVPQTPLGSRSSGYLGLTSFALSRVNSPESDAVLDVIDPANPLGAPRRPQCGALAPAVVIDLDPGLATFDPAAHDAQPGLAEALAALRAAGITIMWSSARPVEDAEKVHAALAGAGLDPGRTDRLLLLKGAGDRKQARRLSAARNWCVIAMAGDRRGDFDEIFDYLKDADTQIPADALFGDGWFLAPPPLPQ